MVSLPTTNELISAFWNTSIKEDDNIFSVLNDDHSAFLGDGESVSFTNLWINKKRQAAALVIQNCWFKYKRKKIQLLLHDHVIDENCDGFNKLIELGGSSRTSVGDTKIMNKCVNRPSSDHKIIVLRKCKTNNKAASIIQRSFRCYLRRKIFFQLMDTLYELLKSDPIKLLKRVNSIESQLFEKTKGNTLIFRFAGEIFPPQIVYKVFTNRSVVNINSSWRVNVNYKPKFKKSKCNSKNKHETLSDDWKIFYSYRKNFVNVPIHQEASKTKQFKYKNNKHHKRSNITWIREMYNL